MLVKEAGSAAVPPTEAHLLPSARRSRLQSRASPTTPTSGLRREACRRQARSNPRFTSESSRNAWTKPVFSVHCQWLVTHGLSEQACHRLSRLNRLVSAVAGVRAGADRTAARQGRASRRHLALPAASFAMRRRAAA